MPMGLLDLALLGLVAGTTLGIFAECVRRRGGLVASNAIAVVTMAGLAIAYSRDDSETMVLVLSLFGSGYALISWHGRRARPHARR